MKINFKYLVTWSYDNPLSGWIDNHDFFTNKELAKEFIGRIKKLDQTDFIYLYKIKRVKEND